MRYFLEIAYNGTHYHGWQVQPNAVTVQEKMDEALSLILRQDIAVLGCGRTDTGVHASQFFLHFDADPIEDHEKLVYKLNGYLPKDISCYRLIPVKEGAHARFDALSRTYQYHVHTFKDPFIGESSMFFPTKLDVDLMNQAGAFLLDQKDFASFCKTGSDIKTTLCDMMQCEWEQDGTTYTLTIKANRFLRNMVRAVVGTMLELGSGKMNLEEFKAVVHSGNRSKAGSSVDACGLFLTGVEYPFL